VERVQQVRAGRDADAVLQALGALSDAARGMGEASGGLVHDAALMPRIIDAVRARATVGEISDVLAQHWGTYRPA
jgi:methylmalonyl-CoA mutase N-terminal domain/subunit